MKYCLTQTVLHISRRLQGSGVPRDFLSRALGFTEIGVGVSRELTHSRPESFCSRKEMRRCRVDDKYLGLLKAFSLTKRKVLGEVVCVLR